MSKSKDISASAFIYAIANRFQEKHHGPLDRAKAIEEAVATLDALEDGSCRFGDPDFDWSAAGAQDVADEAMTYWETVA